MSPGDDTQEQPTRDVELLYEDLKIEIARHTMRAFLFIVLFVHSLRLVAFYLTNQTARSKGGWDLFLRVRLSLAAITYPVIIIVLFTRQAKKGYRLFRSARIVRGWAKQESREEE